MNPIRSGFGGIVGINLSVKGVADELAERLRARADRNHRSLQGELMAILEQAVAAEPATGQPAAVAGGGAAAGLGAAGGVAHRGWKTVEDLLAERRSAPLPASPGAPLAVDIIRADRDSR